MPAHELHLVRTSEGATHDGLLHLARNLNVYADKLIGDGLGILIGGAPGSGKTTTLVRLLEQLGLCYVPLVAFCLEGDLTSLVPFLPHGVLATPTNCPTVQEIYEVGLQVVFDLASWGKDGDAVVHLLTSVVDGLIEHVHALKRSDRVPCIVALDEAAYWLPQVIQGRNRLTGEQYKAISATFHDLSTRGRKMGLVSLFCTQRLASLQKDALNAIGTFILMRQSSDADLKRYSEYIDSTAFGTDDLTEKQVRARIAAFKAGQAVIKLPWGKQGVVQFYNRESEHISHAPKTEAAVRAYRAIAFDRNKQYGPDHTEEVSTTSHVTPIDVSSRNKTKSAGMQAKNHVFSLLDADPNLSLSALVTTTGYVYSTVRRYCTEYFAQHPERRKPERQRSRAGPTLKAWIFSLLDADSSLTIAQLVARTEHPIDTVQKYRQEYFTLHPEKMPPKSPPKMESAVRAQLSINPNASVSQIAHCLNYGTRDVKRILARIRAKASGGSES